MTGHQCLTLASARLPLLLPPMSEAVWRSFERASTSICSPSSPFRLRVRVEFVLELHFLFGVIK